MNDQEALTQAALALRERAEQATGGRWGVHGIGMLMDGTSNYYVIETDLPTGPPKVASVLTGGQPGHWNSRHIAGLDPAVALALAELFEEYANQFPNRTPDQHGPVARKLIALARTYLRDAG